VVKTFEKFKVLTERELHARTEVNLETYCKTVNVEAQLMVLMANRYILPEVLRYQKDVAESVAAVKAAGGTTREGKKLLDRVTGLVDELKGRTDKLANALDHASPDGLKHAKYMRDTIVPAMAALRETGDQIEVLMPHGSWPLPTYREMLFLK
jgi:glutamine synthetase